MDITKHLTVDQIQGYLVKGVVPLPLIYEHLLTQLEEMHQENNICMLPISVFDLYHIKLTKKLIYRIAQHQERKARRKAA